MSGNVTGDGRLNLGGTFTFTSSGVTFAFTIGGWNTVLIGSAMSGQWAMSLTAIGAPGNAYQEQLISTSTHTSTQDAGTESAPASYPLTLPEVLSRMIGR